MMSSPEFVVRRATLDDISQLIELWNVMRFPAGDLARRVTEFQVAADAHGRVIGAIGLQIAERQARIHSEGFTDFALAEELRPRLWDRLNSLANNHGLLRLWTQEDAPFWSRCGLQRPDDEALQKLPELWRAHKGSWLTLKLKDDLQTLASADQEFALFMAAEKLRTTRLLGRAKMLKVIATLMAVALLAAVIIAVVFLLRHNVRLRGR